MLISLLYCVFFQIEKHMITVDYEPQMIILTFVVNSINQIAFLFGFNVVLLTKKSSKLLSQKFRQFPSFQSVLTKCLQKMMLMAILILFVHQSISIIGEYFRYPTITKSEEYNVQIFTKMSVTVCFDIELVYSVHSWK